MTNTSLQVRNYQQIIHMCEESGLVLDMYKELVPIFHTSEIINMRNSSINFRPKNLSKLTTLNKNFTFGNCDVLLPILLMGVELTK